MKSSSRLVSVTALLVAASALVGCSSGSTSKSHESSASPENSVQSSEAAVPAPMVVADTELDGSTQTISADRPLVLSVEDPEGWTGGAEDPQVAAFVAGRVDGSATYNPGFDAGQKGTTSASVTSPDGRVISFTIVVE